MFNAYVCLRLQIEFCMKAYIDHRIVFLHSKRFVPHTDDFSLNTNDHRVRGQVAQPMGFQNREKRCFQLDLVSGLNPKTCLFHSSSCENSHLLPCPYFQAHFVANTNCANRLVALYKHLKRRCADRKNDSFTVACCFIWHLVYGPFERNVWVFRKWFDGCEFGCFEHVI